MPGLPPDAERLQIVATALRRVAPPQFPVESVRLRLDDGDNAGVRRFGSYRQLTVARSFVDETNRRPEFETTIAHEVGHLLDPALNLKLMPALIMAAAGAVLALSAGLGIPMFTAFEVCILLCVILVFTMAGLFRISEYRADVNAARLTSPDAVQAMLAMFAGSGVLQPTGWRGLLNSHPRPEQRQARLFAAITRSASSDPAASVP